MKTLVATLLGLLALLLAAAPAEAGCTSTRVCYGRVCRFEQRCYAPRVPVCTFTNRCYSQRVCNRFGCRYTNVCQPVKICG